ncbi:hypothetical protein FAZ95_24730 [Trinickia violacea]|uniref:Uncharacterized protein n=1 Tax=Trinickia violacea TaxID=2571746 RepID=A0A4P8IT57_9BURK|nr:VENN motif pre-toxin domain-containing protein [Trinickia violacea]QCP52388.1 hypothetical protein FAZ95_24730 [Trinickia violacea]
MAPFLVDQAGGLANLTDGQRAAIVGASMLLGGLTAGLARQNVAGGANAATNESLNNSTNPEDIVHGKDLIPLEGGGGGNGGDIVSEVPPVSTSGSADADSVTTPATNNAGATLGDILAPNGQLVGYVNQGAGANIRTVTPDQFSQIESQLMQDATPVATSPSYARNGGTYYQMPDGTIFGIRQSATSGTTIDVIQSNNPSLPPGFKVHQK